MNHFSIGAVIIQNGHQQNLEPQNSKMNISDKTQPPLKSSNKKGERPQTGKAIGY